MPGEETRRCRMSGSFFIIYFGSGFSLPRHAMYMIKMYQAELFDLFYPRLTGDNSSMTSSPHILLVDDHAIMVDGLRLVLTARFPMARFAIAFTVREALALDSVPDLVILDIMMPGLSGLEGVAMIHRQWPQAQIVILSSQDDVETRRTALSRGAAAFISKTEASHRVGEVVCQLLLGEAALMESTHETIGQSYLTPRQCEVLELMSQGLTNKVIAKRLGLSDNTVRRHVQNIFFFFGVATRTEAVFAARRHGVLDRTPRS